jgi:hypothetical protein
VALHITKKPFIMKLAPMITGVTVATAAGLLGLFMGHRALGRSAGR